MAELSVLIVNYNTWRECAQAIASLRQHGPTRPDGSPLPFECIVVDNRSPWRDAAAIAAVEHELALLAKAQNDPLAGRLILHDENGGYSKGMNLAYRHARGRWLLISNPDLLFGPGLISKLQRQLESDKHTGIAVPKGFWDGEFSGHLPPNTLPTLGDAWLMTLGEFFAPIGRWYSRRLTKQWLDVWAAERTRTLPMMSGCLFLIERNFFERLGRFDERYPLYFEDADLSVAIRRAGRTITQVPDAHLVHFVNRSGMSDLETMWARHHTSRAAYYHKWYGWRGRLTLRWTGRLMASKRLARWRKFTPVGPYTDLGDSASPPVVELGRHCERYLVLMSLDPRFYLAAGTFGSGSLWSLSPTAFALFPHATFYFAVYDVGNGRFDRLGTWRFRSMSHLGQPIAPPPPATVGGAS
jgi:N-acetylglucosaminyl-diphospho-decaprenol L-rhamnosyltransferase